MGFYGCIPRFIKKHAGWILTALGLGGMTGTVILTAKAAPTVERELQNELAWKIHHKVGSMMEEDMRNGVNLDYLMSELDDESDDQMAKYYDQAETDTKLTFGEKFEIAAPHYLPAFLTGLATAACFVGAQIINGRQQAALIAAYGLLAQEFGQYREAIKTEYGEEADQKAMAVAQMETAKLKAELLKLKQENGPFLYTIATLPGVIFESAPLHIERALHHFDRNLMLAGGAYESELYDMIGLPESVWNNHATEYGWETYENEVTYGVNIGHFKVEQIGMKNDQPLYLIDFWIPPYKMGLDYGLHDSSCDHQDTDYRPDYATNAALQGWLNEIVQIDDADPQVVEPW